MRFGGVGGGSGSGEEASVEEPTVVCEARRWGWRQWMGIRRMRLGGVSGRSGGGEEASVAAAVCEASMEAAVAAKPRARAGVPVGERAEEALDARPSGEGGYGWKGDILAPI
ncbi:hypothetical protein GUJ93_ZPchr0007g5132 [Zizania palustris]|uniref:Uncharacterized protein n=1 Tax=Zizania palustris TaxID=103762 RepID=A0A8J5TBI8_ZIZPA|nr:hypothetical protein GUJ93_ZPchr0007g5132 [Zizania palustris]